ncbi:Heterokaryon incompatibility protein 6, OR allele [Pseudocercospora fuligena]|uniref:Heterokaryon incompatibility protein 6, OR allele n=1 Tax=Pseudocercospora fuligena TaxID=685502 RepID=A0A8H6R727_9PEZI|nr:Heterokaryon incompatibility protein 6, OR allele [Pseudocercospora fuligena]
MSNFHIAFKFEPIAEDHLRLLTIAPAPEVSTPLSCILSSCHRSEHPKYTAVSYTWGSVDDKVAIGVNERELRVTKNCELALKAARSLDEPITVWIDAVCINQQNLAERWTQVARMGDTFRLAEETLVFLGPDDGRSWDPFDAEMSTEVWRTLLMRPWFSRTWVIQELLLSKRVTLLVGARRLPYLQLLSVCIERDLELPTLLEMRKQFAHEYGGRPSKRMEEDEASRDQTVFMFDNGQKGKDHNAMSSSGASRQPKMSQDSGRTDLAYWRLPELLEHTRSFGCQDPRDKLFALLPLFQKPIPSALAPNYSKTTQEVFTDLSWFMLEQKLPYALSHVNGIGSSDAPSWTTLWHQDTKHTSIARDDLWRAGYRKGLRDPQPQRCFEDPNMLIIRGLHLGWCIPFGALRRYNIRNKPEVPTFDDFTYDSGFHLAFEVEEIKLSEGVSEQKLRVTILARSSTILGSGAIILSEVCKIWKQHLVRVQSDVKLSTRTFVFEIPSLQDIPWADIDMPLAKRHDLYVTFPQPERSSFMLTSLGKRLCGAKGTAKAFLNIPTACEWWDSVCILAGHELPMVMRKCDKHWRVVGECVIATFNESVMMGGIVDQLEQVSVFPEPCKEPWQEFDIM